jgi:4-amino-4-deoxy-L-arabinose transferase-like glycosyltransferase
VIGRAALVAGFAALLMLPPVGQRAIVSGDEARFAVLAQDMLARGTWFDARVRDQRYRNKPLLYPWAIKVLSLPRGRVTETTARLPIALAAVAGVFFTTLLGQQLFGARAGLFAGLVLATSYAYFAHSQLLLPDMLVVACGLAGLCAFWAMIERQARDRLQPPLARSRWTWLRSADAALAAFYAAVALGVAAKGPMGLLPVPVVVAWLLTEDGVRGLRRLASPLGALAFVVVSGVWLLPYLVAGSRSFARSVVWEDWLAWYLGGPDLGDVVNMLLEAAKGFVPWTVLLAPPLLAVRREWRTGPVRLAFLGWILPLAIVTLSHNHRIRYLLPTYPAAALLVAWWADRLGPERSRALPAVAAALGAAVLVALAVLALPWVDPAERALVDGFWWKAGLIVGGGLALGAYACWALLARRPAALVGGVALGMAALLGGGVTVYNGWVNRGQDYPGLAALAGRHAGDGPIAITGGRFFSIDFYLGRALTEVRSVPAFEAWLGRPDRPVSVVTDRAWSQMRGQLRHDVEVLDTMRVRKRTMVIVRRAAPRGGP